MSMSWNALHFVRPDALWALLALPLLVAVWWLRRRRANVWRQTVDAHLLRHLLVGRDRRAWGGLILLLLGTAIAIVALAGPSWRQVAQPLWQTPSPLVVALDLSSRVTATDLPPSRLLQARAKLATLLRERQGGEVALLVYADDAYTVAPLTDDMANVALYLDALAPDVMPRDGQRADRALETAVKLLQQSGARGGDILLLTDRADADAEQAAASARAQGFVVSVLGLGTPQGAAYRNGEGQIVPARLEEDTLRGVANRGGGRYARIASDDTDLAALDVLTPRVSADDSREGQGRTWRDEGFWLLPPLMLLALFAFRRRGDQVDQQRLSTGVDAYHKGDFKGAQQQFEGIDTDAGWYNLGNALARQGQYDAAIEAYDRALKKHPGMADAVANRAAVDAARKRRPPQNNDQNNDPKDGRNPPPEKPDPGKKPGQGQNGDASPPQDKGEQRQSPPPASGEPKDGPSQGSTSPQAADSQAQAEADAAQRERMQQAMQRQGRNDGNDKAQGQVSGTPQQREQQQAVEAWMRRVPDDPGSLLRAKFQLENERRKREGR
ncbi:hypothetical protein CEE60_04135 [Stenotrophomonas maltophilia]|uniref:VWFA domain-containing protein n=1 Tax=Stenotrophomonas maltophilia TaxID=40324 RepID=A0A246HRL0_STEMA|nr:VWA domain-containing protein [Stenotrophomonas maltophilia]OWQ55998.1 hypothetical protein CEE60_04135 [Stenotrophomonas maltophilia]